MIALALMSVLLLLGWSLMQSIQDAEIRSWKLTQRIRVLRTVRAWLSDDMDHLVHANRKIPTSTTTSRNPGAPVNESFQGDSTGFVATLSPSLDPIRFFQEIVSDSDTSDIADPARSNSMRFDATEGEFAIIDAKNSLWPQTAIDVEYRLEVVNLSTGGKGNALQAEQDVQYELVRREWLKTEMPGAGGPRSAADRTLTANDLYRGVDASDDSGLPPLKESRLYGMILAEFLYFDGSTWNHQWDSTVRQGLPLAIAIRFDFPARADFDRSNATSAREDSTTDAFGNTDTEGGGGSNNASRSNTPETPTLIDPTAQASEIGGMRDRIVESSEREVIIVVETGNRSLSIDTTSISGAFPR
jgi:hypothetical protein